MILSLEQLQLLAQLVDNMEIITRKMEKSYTENKGIDFQRAKQEILESQEKISEIISGRFSKAGGPGVKQK